MKKAIKFLVPLLLGALILASIVWYLFIYDREFTRDSLLEQARFQDDHGNSRISAWFYDAAYSFSGHDENVAIELANQYKRDGNYTKAELTLTTAIHDHPTPELYTALSRAFVEQNKLLDAVNLLDKVSDPEIKAQLDALRPLAPTADLEPGYYSQYMDVRLESPEAKYIFYTTNGEYPSITTDLYQGAITLPAGETTVYAIAVSESGLVSSATVLGYTITGVIEEITFADPQMEAAIRTLIGADAEDPVYSNQLWEILEFTVPEGVATYADLASLPYLTKLTIQNQKIDTLSHLTSLAKLVVLDLTGSRFPVEDLAILAALPSLSSLSLSDCSLSTIEGLSGARNLSYLDLSQNTLRNLNVLSPMTTLVELNLQNNAVTDLSALKDLSNLVRLNISYNSVSSLVPLGSCVRLSQLDASHNQISDLTGLQSLSLLSQLNLGSNALTHVTALAGNTELKDLNISKNSIGDITPLYTLTKLEYFDFSYNQVTSLPAWPDGCPLITIDGSHNGLTTINSLKNMQSMTHVYMDYNLLTNIDILADCFCLVQIDVFDNPITDVSPLRDRDIIVNYNPTVKAEE